MRKINALSLPLKATGLCIIILIYFITSCKKDSLNNEKLSNDELTILKGWQSKNFDQKSILFSGMVPNWNTVYVNELKDKTVYEVDLTSTDSAFITNGFLSKGDKNNYQSVSRFKLLIFKDTKTGKITDGYYMSSLSNEPVHYTEVNNFTGYIYFYNRKGNFINGWVFNAGKALQAISQGNEAGYRETLNAGLKEKINMNNFGNGKIQVASQEFCYTIVTPIYGISCIQAGDSPEPVCSTYIKGYNYGRYCTSVEIPTDGNGGVTPDPNNPRGQTPNIPTLPTVPDEGRGDIVNKIKDPCLKAMVQALLDKGIEFTAEQTLNSIFGDNSSINLSFDQATYTSDLTDGSTTPPIVTFKNDGSINTFNITIKLNEKTLPNASTEFIASTIIHETLHAYFSYRDKVFDPDRQHDEMATEQYIAWFQAAIKKMYSQMDNTDALALAWGGLEGTPAYDTYKTNDPYSVGQLWLTNSEYADGTKGIKCPQKTN
ncbi:hypothetical protein [Pedobacter punctiformis]|uniref:SprT-like domain-containing protein n=1 Tax=Pedobacter punctiformis TaxID=3004097 RepID=A0ABT4LCA8_9SPHI|nr:hypothetical protein [Pedobacter sp. HCMS5-2]MCZ4245539.1 hypothetical protein [Pedobacter sp. HCMS5-2]